MSLAPAFEESKAIYRPSGDHRGVAAPSKSVNCTEFEPSLSQTQICNVPVLVEVNAMRLPSGEYCGLVSSHNPAEALKSTGLILQNVVGGSSGPFYAILFLRAANSVRIGTWIIPRRGRKPPSTHAM